MGRRIVYATRERVMRAADVSAAAYLAPEIDSAIDSASDAVDSLCKRGDAIRPGFAPWQGTIEFDWPVPNNEDAYRFYLNQHALLEAESATSAGADITGALLPWPEYGPPFTALDIDEGSSSILSFTSGRGQRSLSITGEWGYCNAERTATTWTLGASLGGTVTDASALLNAPAGVGSLIRLGDERMVVTEKGWNDSGQTGSIVQSATAQTLAVPDGSVFLAGEELIIEAERLLILAVTGNNLLVKRAVGGTTLAAHTTAAIWWSRTCTVERAAAGTAAASHSSGDQVYLFTPPALIEQLAVAYALDQRQQEIAAYARTIGQGEGQRNASGAGIRELEDRVKSAFGRQMRVRSI